MLECLTRRWGIPLSLYADRHTVFRQTPGTRQKVRAATQFTRAMDEPGIQMVFARSSQGDGRVERMAGTFQNRLVSELRLAGASTILEAKRVLGDFLPRFSERSGCRRSSQVRNTVPSTQTSALTGSSATSTGAG